MVSAIRIDPETGLKLFATRAAIASDKIRGQGYAEIDDEALKTLPPPPPGAAFNAQEQAKYREFKEARRGAADFMAMEGSSRAIWRTSIRPSRFPARHWTTSAKSW